MVIWMGIDILQICWLTAYCFPVWSSVPSPNSKVLMECITNILVRRKQENSNKHQTLLMIETAFKLAFDLDSTVMINTNPSIFVLIDFQDKWSLGKRWRTLFISSSTAIPKVYSRIPFFTFFLYEDQSHFRPTDTKVIGPYQKVSGP